MDILKLDKKKLHEVIEMKPDVIVLVLTGNDICKQGENVVHEIFENYDFIYKK